MDRRSRVMHAVNAFGALVLGLLGAGGDAQLVTPPTAGYADAIGHVHPALGTVVESRPADEGQDVRATDPAVAGALASCVEQSETSVAAYGDAVYVAFNDARDCLNALLYATGDVLPYAMTGLAVSGDGGRTFTDLGPLKPGGPIASIAVDPSIVVDTSGQDAGTVYIAVMARSKGVEPRSTLAVGRSRDQGRSFTWFDAAAAIAGVANVQDKEWLAIDNTGGVRDGWLYLTWYSPAAGIYFSRSADGGATWTTPTVLAASGQGARPIVAPDGTVHVVWEHFASRSGLLDGPLGSSPGRAEIRWRHSPDGGETFSAAAAIAEMTEIGHRKQCDFDSKKVLDGDIRTNEFPSVAIDGFGSPQRDALDYNAHHGTISVVFAGRGAAADEADVFLTQLAPGATTWSPPRRVNDDATTTDQFFPEVAVPGAGRLAIVWTDRREDPRRPNAGNRLMRQYAAVSVDGGTNLENRPLSDALFPPSQSNPSPNVSMGNCYAGDYNALTSAGDGSIIAAWGDNRDEMIVTGATTPIPDPNVYVRRFRVP